MSRALLLLFLCILLVACQAEPTPAPTPTVPPTLAPTATTSLPAVTVAATPTPLPTTVSTVVKLARVRERLQLTLPTGWQTLDLDADGLKNTLAKLQPATDGIDAAQVNRLLAAVEPQSSALLAWADEAAGPSTSLLVTMLPRYELRLESYLAHAQQELAQQPGVTVYSAHLTATLRADGLPAGLLHYTLPTRETEPLDGWQIALFDQAAENLFLFTFTTPSAQSAVNLPVFQEIVRTLTWK